MYVLYIVVCPFVLFLLAIVLSVDLRYTDSAYPFGIFKLFLYSKINSKKLMTRFLTNTLISLYDSNILILKLLEISVMNLYPKSNDH